MKKVLHKDHHKHSHIPKDRAILGLSFAIITLYMIVEFWAGWHFNSLALMADAGHMANDSFSLFLALVALFFSTQIQKYFSLLNGASLILVAVFILSEAIERWQNFREIEALPVLGVAVIGLLVNMLVAWIMLKSDQQNLNIRAAYLHVIADLLGSVIAIVAGLSIYFFNWYWVDIIASILLSIFILKSGLAIVIRSIKQ
ncbi:Co/Zn/Cd efflux system protein [Mannheimia granulomatis]|uniref:cation diffusion facilitator family transporter n=1 Tax=Mannheimia granulomatis TaxID=85402 RepID=UPI00159E69F0|nr:cation diffusion facilitator family transporter [Mannheimia granulomatis]QLB14086.1 Co/Zn/Cd efflux system protein [Mannheimia granulomatis]